MADVSLNDVKKYVKDELKCPTEFIRHLTGCKEFNEMKSAMISGDRDIVNELIEKIRTEYNEYCSFTKLDPSDDNTNVKPGYYN